MATKQHENTQNVVPASLGLAGIGCVPSDRIKLVDVSLIQDEEDHPRESINVAASLPRPNDTLNQSEKNHQRVGKDDIPEVETDPTVLVREAQDLGSEHSTTDSSMKSFKPGRLPTKKRKVGTSSSEHSGEGDESKKVNPNTSVGAHHINGTSPNPVVNEDLFSDEDDGRTESNHDNDIGSSPEPIDVLVSASLVKEALEEGNMQEEDVVAVAKEVSSGQCYMGGRHINRSYIACLAAVIIAVVVVLAVLYTRERPPFPHGTCDEGFIGNGICKDGSCCSPFGFCGNTDDHCVENEGPNSFQNFTRTVGPISEDKICGGYYPDWKNTPRVGNIHPNYNLIFLFAARQTDAADGSISYSHLHFSTDELRAEVQAQRTLYNRTFLLSVGGTSSGFSIPDREASRKFVKSFKSIYDQISGLDGLDWAIFSDGHRPSTEEIIWIGLQLKNLYPSFTISAFVRPFRDDHMEFCQSSIAEGAVDFCSLEFYNVYTVSQEKILDHVHDWVGVLGEEHVVLGLQVSETENNSQRPEEAISIYNETKRLFPNIRGVYNWDIPNDYKENSTFSTKVCTV